MTTSYSIQLNQNNDETLNFPVTHADPANSGTPFDLTGYTVSFYIKTSKTAADSSATVISGTITSAVNGQVTVQVPASALTVAGALWWRLDIIGTGGTPRKTAGCGPLNVQAV